MSIFEKASRLGLRFESPKGQLGVEDLWNLPLTSRNSANLDDIAKYLNKKVNTDEVSFVKESTADEVTKLKFDLVKHIIEVRLKENSEKVKAQETAERRAKILSQIAKLEDQELAGKSKEELLKELQSL